MLQYLLGTLAQTGQQLAGSRREGQDVQVKIGHEWELHIVVGFEVGCVQCDRRWGDLSAYHVTQLIVHAEITYQFCCQQIGVHASEGIPDMCFTSDNQETGQELANCACVDITVLITGIARSRVISVNRTQVLQPVLLAQAQ